MPITAAPPRYAHTDGHTDVCYYTGEQGGMITSGADGDIRIWLDFMDDDPTDACVGEFNTACLSKDGKIYVANDRNTVQILSYPDCERQGIITRFSATVSALTTTKNSKLIVSGACDMRIQVTNIDTSDSIELSGHTASILGLSLDPKEEFVASSSADGTIKVWNIKTKTSIHTWTNVVPKCNSFETAKSFCTPSFNCKDGSFLAYPHGKDIIVVSRGTWKELFRLKCPLIKSDINICKTSECGTKLAACTTHGEVVVWNLMDQEVIGHVEATTAKITSLVWHLTKSTEIAFCDSKGQFGVVNVTGPDSSLDSSIKNSTKNGVIVDNDDILPDYDDDDDDDGENVISLNKIKSSIDIDDDQKSYVSNGSDQGKIIKSFLPEIKLQEPFQPGSTPIHLSSRFMMWNQIGVVKCYTDTNNGDNCSKITVEFHDSSIHHSMHIKNKQNHTLASLSSEALALSCPSNDGHPSELFVIALQSWGANQQANKDWSINLPAGEEALCIAAGNSFIALATSRGNLRVFMITSIQREIIALPGPVVAMNAVGNQLIVAYHSGILGSDNRLMNVMWIHVRAEDMKCRNISLPLTPSAELTWLGLSDLGSPVVMDSEGMMRIFDRKSGLWRVAADTDEQCKGKMDHYFIVDVSEREHLIRCILCKGSHYPSTNLTTIVVEIPLTVPLCDLESEKTQMEAKLWQIGSYPSQDLKALFTFIGHAIKTNLEQCAVEICQRVAPLKVIELSVKYATENKRWDLVKKLKNIAEEKHRQQNEGFEIDEEEDIFAGMDDEGIKESQNEEVMLTPIGKTPQEPIEIRPLTLSMKKPNPFLKKKSSTTIKGLDGLNSMPEKPQKPKATLTLKQKIQSNGQKQEDSIRWNARHKLDLQKGSPGESPGEITRAETQDSQKSVDSETKKRKLSSPESINSESKRPASGLLQYLSDK